MKHQTDAHRRTTGKAARTRTAPAKENTPRGAAPSPRPKRQAKPDAAQSSPFQSPVDVEAVLERLDATYPDADCALVHSNAFELLVATILSAQCTDERVNIVTARMFPKYNKPEHYAGLSYSEMEEMIRDCGLFRNKARAIVDASRMLLEEYDGQVPRTRDELMKLPGVGRKTANVVMSTAFGIPAIAVDTHVFRVANRIGLADAKDVSRTEQQLMEAIPESRWSKAHHQLIHHGRRICSARNPKCHACPIEPYCRYAAEQRAAAAATPS